MDSTGKQRYLLKQVLSAKFLTSNSQALLLLYQTKAVWKAYLCVIRRPRFLRRPDKICLPVSVSIGQLILGRILSQYLSVNVLQLCLYQVGISCHIPLIHECMHLALSQTFGDANGFTEKPTIVCFVYAWSIDNGRINGKYQIFSCI